MKPESSRQPPLHDESGACPFRPEKKPNNCDGEYIVAGQKTQCNWHDGNACKMKKGEDKKK